MRTWLVLVAVRTSFLLGGMKSSDSATGTFFFYENWPTLLNSEDNLGSRRIYKYIKTLLRTPVMWCALYTVTLSSYTPTEVQLGN